MELYFLGTGAGQPSKKRNVTSIALLLYQERGTFWMVDCGEATQHQFLHSPMTLAKLENLFITHLHGDHVFGLPGILTSKSFQSAATPVTIYGPKGVKPFITTILDQSHAHLSYSLQIHEVSDGQILENETFRVTCATLRHGIPSLGYRFEEKPRQGKLMRRKLDALRIPAGPVFQQLKNSNDISLPDGTILSAEQFMEKPLKSRVIVICGDTLPCEETRNLANHADILVHEATYLAEDAIKALKHNHSTSKEAASLAVKACCKTLILTHISARYDDEACTQLLSEAKSVFPNTFLAKDHFRFEIPSFKP